MKGKGRPKLGTVMICIVSPARMLLVKDPSFEDAFWKLPGGSIETGDEDATTAAIREAEEETGIKILEAEMELISAEQKECALGKYHPFLFLARVSEEKLDTRLPIADENGEPMKTEVFKRMQVSTMRGLLEKHRDLVCEAEGVFA